MDRKGQQDSINEVKILASLDNPYVVKYVDSFIEEKTIHIIMEFCESGDLSQHMKAQTGRLISEPKIWKFFIQLLIGLEYIHSKKILHRDIKSMNFFLAKEESIKIGDLGVAKVLSSTVAFAHTMVGTPYYLSPELCEERPYNIKSDMWALGCVLYEMCTLKHPFDALNQGALILKIIRANYLPVSNTYSADLREMVSLLLMKDYKKRPTTVTLLKRSGMKERAIGLNIQLPDGCCLYESPILMIKEIKEEEKIIERKPNLLQRQEDKKAIKLEDDKKLMIQKQVISKPQLVVTKSPSQKSEIKVTNSPVKSKVEKSPPPKDFIIIQANSSEIQSKLHHEYKPVVQKIDWPISKASPASKIEPKSSNFIQPKPIPNLQKAKPIPNRPQNHSQPKRVRKGAPVALAGYAQRQKVLKSGMPSSQAFKPPVRPTIVKSRNQSANFSQEQIDAIKEVENLPSIVKKIGIKDLQKFDENAHNKSFSAYGNPMLEPEDAKINETYNYNVQDMESSINDIDERLVNEEKFDQEYNGSESFEDSTHEEYQNSEENYETLGSTD